MKQAQKIIKALLYHTITGTRQATYTWLGSVDRKILKKHNPVIVLSYHSVAKDDWRFSVDPTVLKKQITYLKNNFDIITLQTLQDYIEGKVSLPKPSVVLTFDDGYKDILVMKDFFKKNDIKPALFVLANTQKPNWKELGSKRPFLSASEIKSLHKAGWEIGCHSATHANLATLTDNQLQQEIVQAKTSLEKTLGIKIVHFAYPRGKYNQRVESYVKKAKYIMALTMDDGFIKPNSTLLRVPRIGVDRTHSFAEFTTAFSPSVIRLRKTIKQSPVGRYL